MSAAPSPPTPLKRRISRGPGQGTGVMGLSQFPRVAAFIARAVGRPH